jgi:hypothetical protein
MRLDLSDSRLILTTFAAMGARALRASVWLLNMQKGAPRFPQAHHILVFPLFNSLTSGDINDIERKSAKIPFYGKIRKKIKRVIKDW